LVREWLKDNIPSLRAIVESEVKGEEAVEITINCNVEAFSWIIGYLK